MSDKKKLIGLNYEEYEHPKDKNALDALSAIPGVDSVTKKIFEKYLDKELFFNVLASGIEVTRDNEPRLHSLLSSCCAILDIHEIPPLYIGDNDLSPVIIMYFSFLVLGLFFNKFKPLFSYF